VDFRRFGTHGGNRATSNKRKGRGRTEVRRDNGVRARLEWQVLWGKCVVRDLSCGTVRVAISARDVTRGAHTRLGLESSCCVCDVRTRILEAASRIMGRV